MSELDKIQINCIVLDDEKPARDGLVSYTEKVDFLTLIGTAKNHLEAKELIDSNHVDLMFADIQMPSLSGIEFVKNLSNPPLVVFTTAHREHAVDGFELNAVDYLVKPISYDRFYEACSKALELFSLRRSVPSDFILVKEGADIVKISLSEITYLEAADDYVFIHMKNSKRHMVLMPLKRLENRLPKESFMRTHRSFIVNEKWIDRLELNDLIVDGRKIPVSRALKSSVKKRFKADRL